MLTRHLGVRLGGDDVDVVTVEVSLRLESGLLSTRRTGNTLPMTATDDDASSRPVGPRSVYVSVNLLGILKSSPHPLSSPSLNFSAIRKFCEKTTSRSARKGEGRSKEQGEKIQEDETAWWLAVGSHVGSHSRMAGKNNNKGEGGGASRGRISIDLNPSKVR